MASVFILLGCIDQGREADCSGGGQGNLHLANQEIYMRADKCVTPGCKGLIPSRFSCDKEFQLPINASGFCPTQ